MRVLMYPNTQAHAGERASLAEYSSKNMDHLGIVVMICREIDLAGEIDRIVGVDPRQKVTCGEAVVAMVLNALGFVDRPLYLFPEFDKSHFREIVKAYEKSLQEMWGKDKIWVWDSAGYTEQTIKEK
jgi:hypothetical protein